MPDAPLSVALPTSGLDGVESGSLGLPCGTAGCLAPVIDVSVLVDVVEPMRRRIGVRCAAGHASEVLESVSSLVGGVDA